jgi:hypothetical protein
VNRLAALIQEAWAAAALAPKLELKLAVKVGVMVIVAKADELRPTAPARVASRKKTERLGNEK